ncbi:MAG: DUF362 domain-containing protein [Anaerolineales bacterium]|nr:DUF362 domain-containing protein [Anaerolineales bacterium]
MSKAAFNIDSVPSQVALVRCDDYDENNVMQAVEKGLALVGGVDQFVHPGEKILLKPNLLVGSAPQKAVTTHPMVFKAVGAHFQAAGARLSYGDSPGFEFFPGQAAQRSGLAPIAESLDIPSADMSHGQDVSFPDGRLIKQFNIANGVLDADGIISLPKLKTHGLTRITGAVKNQFGCIPGMLKAQFHARLADANYFSQMLVDLNRLVQPRLAVMDGIIGMEGNGPRNGSPRSMSVLIFSTDLVAMDAVVCRLIGLDPELVHTITWGEKWELGHYNQVKLVGDPIEQFIVSDFVVNRRKEFGLGGRGSVSQLLKDWITPRPVLVPENCTRCGTCVQVCPVSPKAIDFRSNEGNRASPSYDYSQCIRCYCCQEMCPENAIIIKTPLLGRLLHR